MTDNATVIRAEISRPAPEIVKGFQALATTALSANRCGGVAVSPGDMVVDAALKAGGCRG